MRITSLVLAAVVTAAGGCHSAHHGAASKPSFREILNEYVVARNGKIVGDVRKSEKDEWCRMLNSESFSFVRGMNADVQPILPLSSG